MKKYNHVNELAAELEAQGYTKNKNIYIPSESEMEGTMGSLSDHHGNHLHFYDHYKAYYITECPKNSDMSNTKHTPGPTPHTIISLLEKVKENIINYGDTASTESRERCVTDALIINEAIAQIKALMSAQMSKSDREFLRINKPLGGSWSR